MSLEPGSTPAPSSPQTRLAPHLLVVEDEPVIASLLADVLTRHGYRVTIGHTVADGLALAEKHGDLALCISDFLLPDRTGLDLVLALRERLPRLRIVLISAYLEPELVARIEAVGTVVLIVRKPLDIFELRGRVDELVRGKATADNEGEVSAP
jgi:CheY-like chemotaxis protein